MNEIDIVVYDIVTKELLTEFSCTNVPSAGDLINDLGGTVVQVSLVEWIAHREHGVTAVHLHVRDMS